jgi:hypothetical protein
MYIVLYNSILGCICAAKTAPHFEVLCMMPCVAAVPMNRLGKLHNCSKSSDKIPAHLIVLFKHYKVNPNVLASLHGSEEMHL